MEAALWPWRVAGSSRAAGDPARGGIDVSRASHPWAHLECRRLCDTRCPTGGARHTSIETSPKALTTHCCRLPVRSRQRTDPHACRRDHRKVTRNSLSLGAKNLCHIVWLRCSGPFRRDAKGRLQPSAGVGA